MKSIIRSVNNNMPKRVGFLSYKSLNLLKKSFIDHLIFKRLYDRNIEIIAQIKLVQIGISDLFNIISQP